MNRQLMTEWMIECFNVCDEDVIWTVYTSNTTWSTYINLEVYILQPIYLSINPFYGIFTSYGDDNMMMIMVMIEMMMIVMMMSIMMMVIMATYLGARVPRT